MLFEIKIAEADLKCCCLINILLISNYVTY